MTFKEDIAADLTTFVSADEFAQVLDIDGVLCRCQFLQHTSNKSARLTETFDGLLGDFSELYLMTAPYVAKHGKIPQRGDWLFLNGTRYKVERCEDELGMLHVELSSYRASSPKRGDNRCR